MDGYRVRHDELENLYYKKKKIEPYYSLKDAEKLSKKLLLNILKKNQKKIFKKNVNIISTIFQDLFWDYSFNYIKYKKFIKRHGTSLSVDLQEGKELSNGYFKVKNYINKKLKIDIKFTIINNLKIVYLYAWALFNFFLGNKKKIIVSSQFKKNYRYNFLKNIDTKDIIFLNVRLSGKQKFNSKSINDVLINKIQSRVEKLNHWKFVFKLLKPPKIILMDNLDKDYSILLAAKLMKIKTIGVTHGVVAKYHKWIYGYSFVNKKNILKFDKIYVADQVYKNTLSKYGYIYNKNEIEVSGSLGKVYSKVVSKGSNKYVLYPYEFLTDFTLVMKTLKFFKEAGYKIVIKKRIDLQNYKHFEELDPIMVNDFNNYYFKNALCIFGLSSSILYELIFSNITITSIKRSGLFLYEDIKLPNLIFFDNKKIKDIIKFKKKSIKANYIKKKFINEFSKN